MDPESTESSLDPISDSMRTLIPLFERLPRTMWRIEQGRFMLLDSPDLTFSATFISSAKQIKVLKWCFNGDITAAALWYILQRWPPQNGPLLPELRELEWVDERAETIPLISKLPGSRLQRFSLATSHIEQAEGVLRKVLPMCPQLEFLSVWAHSSRIIPGKRKDFLGSIFPVGKRTDLSSILRATMSLRVLSLMPGILLSPEEVLALAVLPHLTEASFFVGSDGSSIPRDPVAPGGFPALKKLALYSDTLTEHIPIFLDQAGVIHLSEIILGVCNCPSPDSLHKFFDFLAHSPFNHALIKLKVDVLGNEQTDPAHASEPVGEFTITPRQLEPLLRMGSLSCLEIGVNHLQLDASFLKCLALSLSHIQRLVIMHHRNHVDCKFVPLTDLVPFTEHCPDLRYIGFDVDKETENELGETWKSNSRVECIDCGIHNTQMSEFMLPNLSRLFPMVKKVDWVVWKPESCASRPGICHL
ncbi:hypothetical protein SCP_1101700 [Sparassis crispa]|uniref:F-box domain-containing protein n=1 Tax=Sparassis crispa TaxID=139825 RepID=A0A401GZA4_9APHY|nr:hypothetical protein SCP_1101700 [Sparassis crispa]GBE87493.1 hypothetical protein SCP_1101700 [Sparassis crispa]